MHSALEGLDEVQPSDSSSVETDQEHADADGRPLTVVQVIEALANNWNARKMTAICIGLKEVSK
jgi:hypothetical protein